MPSENIDGLRQELNAALAVLLPKIRGLEDLTKVSLSPQPLASVEAALARHNQRRQFLNAGIKTLDALDLATDNLVSDGYPEPLVVSVSAAVFEELQEQKTDFAAAFGEFEPEPKAVGGTISLGTAVENP